MRVWACTLWKIRQFATKWLYLISLVTIRKALFSPRMGAAVGSLGREPQDQPAPPHPPRFHPVRRPNSGRRPELGRRTGWKRGELGVGTANLGLTPQATS